MTNIWFYVLWIISIFIAIYTGFYFGYLKREEKPPEKLPVISEIKDLVGKLKPVKEEKSTGFFD